MEAEKVVVGSLSLLMSGEADFDEAKGELEAHWQIYLGEGQGEGHFEMRALQHYEDMGFKEL